MVRGGSDSGLCGVLLVLALVCLACRSSASSTPEGQLPSSAIPSTTATIEIKGKTKEEKFIRREINTLLKELRQVAQAVEAVRKEHDRLSKGVSDIGKSVKDMNELSLHIKKKVRKMSKILNKNSHGHNHKLKDGLKSLKKDHEHIIRAVTSLTLHHRSLYGPNHHKKMHKYVTMGVNANPENTTEETISSSKPELAEEGSDQETSNDIPDLVLEPPEGSHTNEIPMPKNCLEVLQMGNYSSGAYNILPKGMKTPIQVWCDHTTAGGGWTSMVARKSQDKQLDFALNWDDYKTGFGDLTEEHWIGTEALHFMTLGRQQELRVNITDWNDTFAWAGWKEFSVGAEEDGYILHVDRYVSSSTAGDALKWHNGMKFSTPDKDNDILMGGHCARVNSGGWWYRGYRGCYQAHPTGMYQKNPSPPPKTKDKRIVDLGPVLAWQNWRGETYFPKTLFLMFRPIP